MKTKQIIWELLRATMSVMLAVSIFSCNSGNGSNEKTISDSSSSHSNSKGKCNVIIKCHYLHIPRVSMWNVEIDSKPYHKGFRDDATEDEVKENATNDCIIGQLYADRWIDEYDTDCK